MPTNATSQKPLQRRVVPTGPRSSNKTTAAAADVKKSKALVGRLGPSVVPLGERLGPVLGEGITGGGRGGGKKKNGGTAGSTLAAIDAASKQAAMGKGGRGKGKQRKMK